MPKVICDCCSKEFNKYPKEIENTNSNFCSRSCAAKVNNKKFPKRKRLILREKNCLNCNCLMTKEGRKYCSRKCRDDHFITTNRKKFETDGFGPNVVNSTIRKFLINKNGNSCMICGLDASNWHGKQITLIVDHIDGKANNNDMSNLRIVCPNCDSQLETFKGRNIGKSTRKYYIIQK